MNITKIAAQGIKVVKKYTPEILLGLGIVGTGATVYKTYKTSPKIDEILTEFEKRKAEFEEAANKFSEGEISRNELEATPAPDKRMLVRNIAKEMAVPTILGIASIASFVTSYRIQRSRILGLSAALATSSMQYNQFKERVEKEIGSEKFKQLIKPVVKKNITTTNEKGKEQTKAEQVKVKSNLMDGVWFSQSDEYASDNHEYNTQYVESIISQLELVSFNKNGLVMNEALEAFGIEKTRQGALLGWSDDGFSIEKEVIYTFNEEEGIREPQIYIHWSAPKYIYDSISYDNAYYID